MSFQVPPTQFVEEAADAVSGSAVSFDLVQVAAAQGAKVWRVMSQVAVADHDGGFGQGELGAASQGLRRAVESEQRLRRGLGVQA